MHRPSLSRARGQRLLVAAAAFCVSQACQSDAPSSADTSSAMPGDDGTDTGSPEGTVGPDMGSPGAADPSMGTSGEGVPTPSLTGNEGQGGASTSEGTGTPADMPGATGGASADPGAPGFEQDDPNLHPPEFIRNRMAEVRTDDDGNIVAVNDLFGSFTWNSMIQARISPNGVLHVAQFGGASTVYRMNYVGSVQQ